MDHSDNKRIAKNTIFLYIRTFISVLVSLYTTRVIWQVLGIENYGIYNVVGGIVLMFNFLIAAMVSASQRFITFELGRGNHGNLSAVFSISIRVHFILAGIILLLSETLGVWFVNYKLNIPAERMFAANCIYQASVMSFLIGVVSVPYNALIVAFERIQVYGYLGLLEVFFKLGIVYLLLIIPYDKLIVYSLLILAVSAVMRLLYGLYCSRYISECQYIRYKDQILLKKMFSFAGWSLVGNFGFSARDQGLNIILNLFFDVTMNAAKGIATSVSSVIQGFIANFQMAVNPQITKLYASGREMEMVNLVMYSAKYSFYLVLFVAVPFFFQCEYVLNLWIGNVSVEMLTFMRLTLIMMLIDSMVSPVVAALCATGNIKKFQILISIVMLLNLPMAYVWLKLQANPYIVSYTAIFTSAIGLFVRLKLLSEQTCFSLKEFMLKVIFRILPVAVIVSFFAYALYNTPTSLVVVVIYCLCTLFFSTIVVFLLGLGKPEREVVLNQIKLKIKGDSAN